jgi:hypothetical protein
MNGLISLLGLDTADLNNSVKNLLGDLVRTEAALSLTGDAARDFMDVLLKVGFRFSSDIDHAAVHNAFIDCRRYSSSVPGNFVSKVFTETL